MSLPDEGAMRGLLGRIGGLRRKKHVDAGKDRLGDTANTVTTANSIDGDSRTERSVEHGTTADDVQSEVAPPSPSEGQSLHPTGSTNSFAALAPATPPPDGCDASAKRDSSPSPSSPAHLARGSSQQQPAQAVVLPAHAGEELDIKIVKAQPSDPLGMTIDRDTGIVNVVDKAGPAERAGVVAGMRIKAVNGAPIATLDDIKKVVAEAGPAVEVEFTVADNRLPQLVGGAVMIQTTREEVSAIKRDLIAAREREKEMRAVERRSSMLADGMRKSHRASCSTAESKVGDVRRIQEQISKSKQAQALLALEEQSAASAIQRSEHLVHFKQVESAIKISLKDVLLENRALLRKVMDKEAPNMPVAAFLVDVLGASKEVAETYITTAQDLEDKLFAGKVPTEGNGYAGIHSSPEVMKLAVQHQGLEEQIQEKRAVYEKKQAEEREAQEAEKQLQRAVTEKEAQVKGIKQTALDLTEENALLAEERKRLVSQIAKVNEEYQDTVKQLTEKIRAVGVDKDRHLQQAADMMSRVHDEEGVIAKNIRDMEGLIEQAQNSNRNLAKDNRAIAAEQQKLEARARDAQARVDELNAVRKRWAEAEKDTNALAEKAAKARQRTAALFKEKTSLATEKTRLTNLIAEKGEALAVRVQQTEQTESVLAVLVAELAELLPVEADKKKSEDRLRSLVEAIEYESGTARGRMRELLVEEARTAELHRNTADLREQVRKLRQQTRIAREGVDMRRREIESLTKTHEQTLRDVQVDADISRKKAAAKLASLKEQLKLADERAAAAAESLATLENRFGAHCTDEPEEAPTEHVTYHEDASKPGEREPSLLELTEELAKLTDLLEKLQERVWSAEACIQQSEEEGARNAKDINRKQAVLNKHLEAFTQKGNLQDIVERTMKKSILLRDENTRLREELERLQPT